MSASRSVADTFRVTLDLFEAGVSMMRQNLRRADPSADDARIEARLQTWLRTRPGAEFGDGDGEPVDLLSRRR